MLAVIADDITGAAEIAGIAYRYGLSCQLSIGMPTSITGTDILVIATDSRSYHADEAYSITADITRRLYAVCTPSFLFRKTDSALRGNVRDELQAIIDHSPYTDAIFMPANPSKGRIIKDGVYYIVTGVGCRVTGDGGMPSSAGATPQHLTPLHETDFRFDPEFPAVTSNVKERFPDLTIPDATCKADIDDIVARVITNGGLDGESLFLAGAADLFTSLLHHVYNPVTSVAGHFHGLSATSAKLIVRGSTQSKAIDLGMPVEVMPLDVFYEKAAPCTWAATILARQHANAQHQTPDGQSLILTIGDKEVRTGKSAAVYLRQAMAEVTCAILAASSPDELVIEGGATAFAILSQTPWQSFSITDEIAPGVVRMQPDGQQPTPGTQHPIHITLKPGSYDWGKLF